jgi:hypothetical protein
VTQLEENLEFRMTRLEQKLKAYRKLHAGELEELARGIAELRREFVLLREAATLTAGQTASTSVPRAYWPSILRRDR